MTVPDTRALGTVDAGTDVVDPAARRPDVVRRLLACGVSPRALRSLLPDWEPMILEVADADPRS